MHTVKTSEIGENTNQPNRIANFLLLNSSFIDDLGLLHGKMGISIYFFHLARQTKNQIYEDYAGELIDEIYEELSANTQVEFENGLAGIGWGIEYLVQNNFIEADTNEVLEEFDIRIFTELINSTPKEIGLLRGIVGFGVYFLARIQNPTTKKKKPTHSNRQNLIHIIDELERRLQKAQIEKLLNKKASVLEIPINSDSVFPISETEVAINTFDISWDYPILIWFLAELIEQNICYLNVEKIIQRLIDPLKDDDNLQIPQSNQLFLALSLQKLIIAGWPHPVENIRTDGIASQTIPNKLLSGIDREVIKSELIPNSATMKYGSLGIAWIYKQLDYFAQGNNYKEELEFWSNQCLSIDNPSKVFAGFDIEKNDLSLGLMEGLTGIGLFNIIYNCRKLEA